MILVINLKESTLYIKYPEKENLCSHSEDESMLLRGIITSNLSSIWKNLTPFEPLDSMKPFWRCFVSELWETVVRARRKGKCHWNRSKKAQGMFRVESRGSRGFTGSFPSDKTNSGHDRSLEGENCPKKRAPDWLINIAVYTVNVTPRKSSARSTWSPLITFSSPARRVKVTLSGIRQCKTLVRASI